MTSACALTTVLVRFSTVILVSSSEAHNRGRMKLRSKFPGLRRDEEAMVSVLRWCFDVGIV